MNKHEEKYCPRCRAAFECKPGNITQCQCYRVKVGPELKAFMEQRYSDCLCRNCLLQLSDELKCLKEKSTFR
jgi:Cysteine-rich CWC